MSLTTNNTSLQEILAKVNALPEAGSGSGGAVETCTVTFVTSDPFVPNDAHKVIYTDEEFISHCDTWIANETVLTVPKGTFVVVKEWSPYSTVTNATVIYTYDSTLQAFSIDGDAIFTFFM